MAELRVIDWQPIRNAYIDRPERPTFAALSVEFNVPGASINRCSNDEGWAFMRAQRLKVAETQSDAIDIIKASVGQTLVADASRDTALSMIKGAGEIIVSICESDKSDAVKSNVLSNLGFALANTSKLITAAGLVGLPKKLTDAIAKGEGANGKEWTTGLLQQINVTVNGLQAAKEKAQAETGEKSVEEIQADTKDLDK